jgi:hypothetical protein
MKMLAIPVHKDLYEDPLLWDITLDTGFTQQQVMSELTALDWENSTKCVQPLRYEMRTMPVSPALNAIEEYVRGPEFKSQMLDVLYEGRIDWYWSMSREEMDQVTVTGGLFVKDLPGFQCPRHVDTRSLVSTGMLMFNDVDIPEQHTFFTREKKSTDRYWESNSEFGRGWLNAVNHNTWHEGYNNSNVDRYAYLFHLSLKLF